MRGRRSGSRSLVIAGATILQLAVLAVLAGSAGARVPVPPRIVAAQMLDADGDARADGLRLTYSRTIRHPVDRDGAYPFSVAGYAIGAVGPARGRLLVLALRERGSADPAARPSVRYRPTRSGGVVS